MKFYDHYRGIAAAKVSNGDTIMFWADVWNSHYLVTKLPRLYSFAKDKKISVAQFLNSATIQETFLYLFLNKHIKNYKV